MHRLHEAESGEGARIERLGELLIGQIIERIIMDDLGVVHEDIDAAELAQRALDRLGNIRGLADVAADCDRLAAEFLDRLGGAHHLGFGTAGDNQRRPLPRQRKGDALAHALARAGHDRDFAV